ncbi:DNA repair protein RecO [Thalassotalea sp. Y01]|uniref:DNA repair protein RecO n=1 Tax=Thalassotalea sp. Y01 TaxID=2729613 RepID=UPI00145F2B11|nr:DNA repair protein RecO [Thalassotalea sp. Y01]
MQLQRAYLLHSRPYRDNSRLLNLFTENDGHIGVIAYTSSSGKNAKAGQLQPFAALELELKGDASLKTLSKVERAEKSLMLQQEYLYSGFYLNELLVRLLPENIAANELFYLYAQTLNALADGQAMEPLLRRFEMTLLQELGQGIDFSELQQMAEALDVPTEGHVAQPDAGYSSGNELFYHYRSQSGFVVADNSKEARYASSHLQQIGLGNLSQPDVLLTCKRLMRQVLNQQLGDKPLHSRSLFASHLNKGKK